MSKTLDWSDLELVRLVATEGSLTGAARRLGVDQTTAARRLQRIERRLGTALFDRIDRRLVATRALADVAPALDAMQAAAAAAGAALGSARDRLAGRVTVSAVDAVAAGLLAPAVPRLLARHPGLALDLGAEDRNVAVGRREADVALRLGRPDEDAALTRRLGALAFGWYGAAGDDGLGERPAAGYGPDLGHVPEARWLAERLGGAAPALASNRASVLREAVAAGFRAVLPDFAAARDPRLVRLRPDPVARRDVWIVIHPDRRRDPAVAAVVDWIAETIGPALA